MPLLSTKQNESLPNTLERGLANRKGGILFKYEELAIEITTLTFSVR